MASLFLRAEAHADLIEAFRWYAGRRATTILRERLRTLDAAPSARRGPTARSSQSGKTPRQRFARRRFPSDLYSISLRRPERRAGSGFESRLS
jgi:plasmid stabilization system protein ParE